MNLWAVFLTGLFTGGLTCLAVQGGLLATTIAQREEEKLKEKTKQTGNAFPILAFLGAKLIGYTILGFLLGWLGQTVKFSLGTQTFLQFVVGIFMLGTALSLLDVHPIFRYFVVQPPRFLTRIVRKQSKSNALFAPGILGFFTVFIPCGTTQAMMALAIASGNPLSGAAILFAFVLGTSPLFFVLGYFATKLGDALHRKFMRFAAFAIILLAVFNINNAIALTGSNFTLENMWQGIWCTVSFCENTSVKATSQTTKVAEAVIDNPTIEIASNGYTPQSISIKAGSQVTLHIKNIGGAGCTQSFTIPKLGLQKLVPVGTSDTITFTAPSEPGQLPFMCSMGMFRGTFNVI